MADANKIEIKHKLVGYTPYKTGKGKVLFINRYGASGVCGVACDVVFLNGKNHEKITVDAVGREVVLHKGYNKESKEYYVFDVDIK